MNRLTDATITELQLANAEIMLAASRIASAIRDPALRHELPGRIADCHDHFTDLLAKINRFTPEVHHALQAGLPSTQQLEPPRDYIVDGWHRSAG